MATINTEMKFKRRIFVGCVLALLVSLALARAFGAASDWWSITSKLKVGDTEDVVRRTMADYKEQSWKSLTNHSSERRLQFLFGQQVRVWLVDAKTLETEGGESYVIGVFSNEKKLTDLLHFRAAMHLRPIIRGTYAERLSSIKKGMSVDEMYRLLGEAMPYRYHRDKTGKWLINFSYQGAGSDFWIYDVDAASGTIVGAHGSSI